MKIDIEASWYDRRTRQYNYLIAGGVVIHFTSFEMVRFSSEQAFRDELLRRFEAQRPGCPVVEQGGLIRTEADCNPHDPPRPIPVEWKTAQQIMEMYPEPLPDPSPQSGFAASLMREYGPSPQADGDCPITDRDLGDENGV